VVNCSLHIKGTGDQVDVDEDQASLPTKEGLMTEQKGLDADARLAARLKQILSTPGISDKDRKLVEQNLQRLLAPTKTG
jgi:hypothetical protein